MLPRFSYAARCIPQKPSGLWDGCQQSDAFWASDLAVVLKPYLRAVSISKTTLARAYDTGKCILLRSSPLFDNLTANEPEAPLRLGRKSGWRSIAKELQVGLFLRGCGCLPSERHPNRSE